MYEVNKLNIFMDFLIPKKVLNKLSLFTMNTSPFQEKVKNVISKLHCSCALYANKSN